MNIASECFDNHIRADQIIWLSCQADQYVDALCDLFTDDLNAEELTALFDNAVTFTEVELGRAGCQRGHELNESIGEFVSRLYRAGKRGFLVQVGIPTPQVFHEDGGVTTYGFGWYRKRWFYTETLDGAFIQNVLQWKKQWYAQEEQLAKREA